MTIYSNSTGATTVRNAFIKYSQNAHHIRLASPFFSYSDILKEIGAACQAINLLVRLGPATSADELRKAYKLENVTIRYFTSSHFHSKLYIFGDACALVGSANLTTSGMQSNREIIVTVFRENPDFDDLIGLFETYWAEAEVLNDQRLAPVF